MKYKELILKYFSPSDILYIQFVNKKQSIGDEEFQDEVILFRDPNSKEVIGVEIINFTKSFKDNFIQITKTEAKDFHKEFRFLRAIISLQNIILSDPEEFEKTMEIWGYKRIKQSSFGSDKIELPFDCSKVKTKLLSELLPA